MIHPITFVLLGLLALGPIAAPAAAAGNVAKAKRLFRQAEKQFAAGAYQQALELYQQAYKAKPLPGFHLNIGQCYRNLARCEKAIEHYRQYVAASKNPKHRSDAEKLIQFCEEELARSQPAPPSVPAEQQSAIEQPPDLRGRTPPPPRRQVSRRHGVHPAVFWTGVGVTAATLAAGTITGVLALRKSSQFNDPSTPPGDLRGLKDSGEVLKTSSTALFCASAAVAVGTTVLFFFTDFGRKEAKLAVAPVVGGGVVVLGGKF
jgi:hypothetical protein